MKHSALDISINFSMTSDYTKLENKLNEIFK